VLFGLDRVRAMQLAHSTAYVRGRTIGERVWTTATYGEDRIDGRFENLRLGKDDLPLQIKFNDERSRQDRAVTEAIALAFFARLFGGLGRFALVFVTF